MIQGIEHSGGIGSNPVQPAGTKLPEGMRKYALSLAAAVSMLVAPASQADAQEESRFPALVMHTGTLGDAGMGGERMGSVSEDAVIYMTDENGSLVYSRRVDEVGSATNFGNEVDCPQDISSGVSVECLEIVQSAPILEEAARLHIGVIVDGEDYSNVAVLEDGYLNPDLCEVPCDLIENTIGSVEVSQFTLDVSDLPSVYNSSYEASLALDDSCSSTGGRTKPSWIWFSVAGALLGRRGRRS